MTENILQNYLSAIARTRTATASAGIRDLEHQHRPALKVLLEGVLPDVQAINETGKVEFGMLDFALIQNGLPIGYVETKPLETNLDEIAKGEQLKRYFGYANLILTNYLEFRFYKHGEAYGDPIIVADVAALTPDANAYILLETTMRAFLEDAAEPVRRASRLAEIMGEHGKRLRANLLRFLKTDNEKNRPILDIYDAFKTQLIHDLSTEDFADMYAQTLVYGLFVARYHDETQRDFTRQEARELIPNSNPLLRRFFDHIAGADFDDRLKPIVDGLCKVFGNTDVRELMQQLYRQDLWGGTQAGPDPVIHFYEDFLKEYDPEKRKKGGVYYTPPSVVNFLVRSVDEVLKRDFGLAGGLADTSRISHTQKAQGKKVKADLHRVQVLDPATGTGTFLNEIIRLVRASFGEGQRGRFPSYVREDLLPRLHGFELMMASYTIAHLKLAATLRESGATDTGRVGVYLTNTLEPAETDDGSLFSGLGLAKSINEESQAAARIKNDTPIMVVVGNPPYSVSSQNKGEWIQNLIVDYKKDLGERKINLDDDYIKFIRFAENLIEKNGTGIVAMITNNSYIDGITHRQMRKHLLETFDDIYIIDLHGNAKKREKAPDGGKDENVFDIMQGVSIAVFIRKNAKKKGLGTVHHAELYGHRADKFTILDASSVEGMEWRKLETVEPYYFFVPKDMAAQGEYETFFSLNDLFINKSSGFRSGDDDAQICWEKEGIVKVVKDLIELPEQEFRTKYSLVDGRNHNYAGMKKDVGDEVADDRIIQILYRPFDTRWTYFSKKSSGFAARPRNRTMNHFLGGDNIGMIMSRIMPSNQNYNRIFVTDRVVDEHAISDQNYIAPLYLYAEDGTRVPNLNTEILEKITEAFESTPTPEDIFDYVYAVLHSPSYREKYEEFLKIDFPRVPYPKDETQFRALTKFGRELRKLHLLESARVQTPVTTYPVAGSNVVQKIRREGERVFINDAQYFGNVSETAWQFFIGGYQPAQKWLKDRVGHTLTSTDIEHYQKIIVALTETRHLMSEIGTVLK